jgi:predicted outer membrane repeat protein
MGVGGGMSCTDSSAASLSHVTFQENFGDGGGGGMYCSDSSPNLTNVTFLDNESVGSGPGIGGGAILCVNSSMPVLQDCTFSGNGAMDSGGGMWCKEGSDATLLRALFYGNGAQYGGALNCDESSPTVTNCTFSGNEAVVAGGAIFCYEASPVINRTILAFSVQGEGLYCYDAQSSPTLTCCDVLGNAGGDWVGCIASQYGTDGNISEDPLFCNTAGGDFSLEDCSPCLPGNHPDGYDCGGVIGAYGSGCGCGSAAEPTTWGAIKRMYRCPESQ